VDWGSKPNMDELGWSHITIENDHQQVRVEGFVFMEEVLKGTKSPLY